MTEADRLTLLRTAQDVRQLLERDFDFLPRAAANTSCLFHLAAGKNFELFGCDGSGGEFVLCSDVDLAKRPVLFVSSEGQAGIIGRDLEQFLSIIIAMPCWMDCLKFSGGGQLAEMRRAFPLCESDLSMEKRSVESSRRALMTRLQIQSPPDPILALHENVREMSPRFFAYAKDGWQFEGLFGKFTVDSNPAWRRK